MSILQNLTAKAVGYIAAAIIVPLLVYTVYSYIQNTGLKVTNSALKVEIERLKVDYGVCKSNRIALELALEDQNNAVTDLKEHNQKRQEEAAVVISKARASQASLKERIRSLEQMEGVTCADAEAVMDEALGL